MLNMYDVVVIAAMAATVLYAILSGYKNQKPGSIIVALLLFTVLGLWAASAGSRYLAVV